MDIEEKAASAEKEEKTAEEKPVLTKKERFVQAVKFVAFSASAGVIQIGSFALLDLLMPANELHWLKYLISLVLSVLWNFTLNREFTFKSAANVPAAMLKVFGYYCVFTPLTLWWGQSLVNDYGWNDFLVEALTMVLNMVTEFLFCTFVVYRNSMNTKKKRNTDKNTEEEQ
ncbi:MAG: GtrA family protein [Bacillota bacterium]|nr:MAG: GtrA family protein [Bacillota bacterium]